MNEYDQNNQGFFDIWAIFTGILQILTYEAELKSTSNDELMKELRKQDSILFKDLHQQNETIIRQNAQILEILKNELTNTENNGII